MNVGYKHAPYNYKFFNCSWTVLHYQKVHFFFKSTAQQNFLAMGLSMVSIEVVESCACNSPFKVAGLTLLSAVIFSGRA